jgi:hypothetical protein
MTTIRTMPDNTVQGRLLLHSVFVVLSCLVASAAWATPDPGAGNWSEWKAMDKGYTARKRLPPPKAIDGAVDRSTVKPVAARMSLPTGSVAEALWLRAPEDGLYRLTVAELLSLTGWQEKDLRKWLAKGGKLGLSVGGESVSWHYDVTTDALYFVGTGVRSMFATENAYRLEFGSKLASIMTVVDDVPPAPASPQPHASFVETRRLEQDLMNGEWALVDADADYWFWHHQLGGQTKTVALDLPGLAPLGAGELTVSLQGASSIGTWSVGDEHQVTASLKNAGGTVVASASASWSGFAAQTISVPFDQAQLSVSGNVLELRSESVGVQLLDYVDARYNRALEAVDGKLWLRHLGVGRHTISGFSSDSIAVIESPASSPLWRRDFAVAQAADGITYEVTFDAAAEADYLVVDLEVLGPLSAQVDQPSDLAKGSQHGADYLIVAPRSLEQTARALQDHRLQRFGNVEIAWIEDIFDEFNYGVEDAGAIERFLDFVHTKWRKTPQYVVLLGKGTLDHRDLQGFGDSLMPLLLTATPWGLTAADNRYFDVDDDGVAEFSYGRIPVRDDDEGLAYVAKLAAYEQQVPAPWMDRAVLAADNPDIAGDFPANTQELATFLADLAYTVNDYYAPPAADVRAGLTDPANWSSAFVGYDGHGSIIQIGDWTENFLSTADVPSLVSGDGNPVFAAFTCSAGNDSYPGWMSLAGELALKPDGGAIAALAPTGFSIDSEAHELGKTFVDALLGDHQPIGDAWREAQRFGQGAVSDFMLKMYQVTGDPAVMIP